MKTAYLYRNPSTDQGTTGVFVVNGFVWHSLELPNRNNKPNISCVPIGEYVVSTRYSPSFKRILFHVKDVKGRSFILIHGANFAGDIDKGWQTHLQGCITLGKGRGTAVNRFKKRQRCVFNSRSAIREMMEYFDNKPFKLIIKDV